MVRCVAVCVLATAAFAQDAAKRIDELYWAKDFQQAAELATQLADKDDAFGQAQLGWMLTRGEGVEKDVEKGVALLRKAVEKKHPRAQAYYGMLVYGGRGVEQNALTGQVLFQKSAEAGDAEGQLYHGMWLAALRTWREACPWFGKSAAQGHPRALDALRSAPAKAKPGREHFGVPAHYAKYELGLLYATGRGVPLDIERGRKLLSEVGRPRGLFEAGHYHYKRKDYANALAVLKGATHADALWLLGEMHLAGHGVAKDEEKAAGLFAKAAKAKSFGGLFRHAQRRFAAERKSLFARSDALRDLPHLALHPPSKVWLEQLAESGDRWALVELGLRSSSVVDMGKRFRCLKRAADAHHAVAIHELATCYRKGIGTKKDEGEADRLLRELARGLEGAVHGGRKRAQPLLGRLLIEGRGIGRAPVRGVNMLAEAARRPGDARAAQEHALAVKTWADRNSATLAGMETLACLHMTGVGTPKNHVEGVAWSKAALPRGAAETTLEVFAVWDLGPAEAKEANRKAEAYFRRYESKK